MRDTIYRDAAIDELYKMLHDCFWADDEELDAVITTLNNLPSAQTDSCLGSIISEIEKTISETRENGKRHDINIRANGELICYGLQLALDIIEEKKNGRIN